MVSRYHVAKKEHRRPRQKDHDLIAELTIATSSNRYNPAESTIRGLLVLALLHAGRGFDGPCFVFVRLALCLTEDFGLHLGSHRFNSMGSGVVVAQEKEDARRNLFWTAYASDVIASMCESSLVLSSSQCQ